MEGAGEDGATAVKGYILRPMSLSPGGRVGSFEILGHLGSGGMGEVYRARDLTLNRDVALKILPQLFALDPDRLVRFKREAQVLASLNHPNIATIHGFEESNGFQALVLELVEGPTLAERIASGPIPVDEALAIAAKIAEALEAAHEQGIIHRDLKPANVKLRPNGTVKVLDFGLAKVLEPAGAAAGDATASPTITSPAMTAMGLILGTAAYMSPEQARGRPADKRADIWAFGVVLWEMLTGRKLFFRDTASDSMAAVLQDEPSWDDVSPRLRPLLRRCLEKDPRKRLHDIADARLWLDEAPQAVAASAVGSSLSSAAWRVLAGGLAGLVAAAGLMVWGGWRTLQDERSFQFSIAAAARHDLRRIALGNGHFARRSVDRLLGEHCHHAGTLPSFSGFRIDPVPLGYGTRGIPVLVAGQSIRRLHRPRQTETTENRRWRSRGGVRCTCNRCRRLGRRVPNPGFSWAPCGGFPRRADPRSAYEVWTARPEKWSIARRSCSKIAGASCITSCIRILRSAALILDR